MTTRAVHWHAGMFLRPQHFQAAQRHALHEANRGEKWDVQYNWGMRSVDLDLNALGNYRLVVRSLEARLRDGTLVSIPEDGLVPPLELQNAFEAGNRVTVYLGVPILHAGRANVLRNGEGGSARFLVEKQEIEDENTGVNAQELLIRRLNFKLLLSSQETSGYELLPIARLDKSSRAEATPQLDAKYIPPILACDAWRPLAVDILQAVYDRLGKIIETLANQVVSRGMTFDSYAQGDPQTFGQLRVLNEAFAVLEILAFAQGVSPLMAYTELCRLAGQLAIFGETRRTPTLPRYDHDDLGGCFFQVQTIIYNIFKMGFREPEYKERPFLGAGLRMQVSLEPAWLESTWDTYIGVQSPFSAEDCLRLLRPGQLDMKIGSSERVDAIFKQGQEGLKFVPCPTPPRVLPALPGQIYLQVDRDASTSEWQNVQRSLSLAIRMNESLIAGDIQGQRVLRVKSGTQTTSLQFTLYVVPR